MTISISELEAVRAAMTRGEYAIEHDRNAQANIYTADGQWIAILPHQCVRSIELEQNDNAIGIVAEHNAMPVLLSIVKAALAYAADCSPANWRTLYDMLVKVRP